MAFTPSDPGRAGRTYKRRLRAAFSADVANFSGNVSVSETKAFGNLAGILKIGREELENHDGVLIGVPGDGLLGLFESVVNAVQCALSIQERLRADSGLGAMRLRIGIHMGDVLFDGDLPFGETLNIAARLQALAEPGGMLVSGSVVDAVSARVTATFQARGVPQLKNIPRRISTFAVTPLIGAQIRLEHEADFEPLDQTMQLPTRKASEASHSTAATSAVPTLKTELAGPRAEHSDAPSRTPQVAGPITAKPETAQEHSSNLHGDNPSDGLSESGCVDRLSSRNSPLAEAPTAETIAFFGDAFAVHLGPVGRVITERKAKLCGSLAELLAALEKEIPTSAEQYVFRCRIKRQFEL